MHDPADLPDDYFRVFDDATDRPLLLVEGGWNSADTPLTSGTPAEQADFFRRVAALLDGVEALTWISLTFADLDLATFGLPPDREAALSNFARMGIVDSSFDPKPAAAVWDSVRTRPLD